MKTSFTDAYFFIEEKLLIIYRNYCRILRCFRNVPNIGKYNDEKMINLKYMILTKT